MVAYWKKENQFGCYFGPRKETDQGVHKLASHSSFPPSPPLQLLRAILMQMRMTFNTQLQQANSPESLKQVKRTGWVWMGSIECMTSKTISLNP